MHLVSKLVIGMLICGIENQTNQFVQYGELQILWFKERAKR